MPLGKKSRKSLIFQSLLAMIVAFAPVPLLAQPAPAGPVVPSFWSASRRLERPDTTRLPSTLRFLTSDDYPPFNFSGPEGALMGFNVDLARAVCAELALTCTLQAVDFDTLLDALDQNKGDAVIAGLAATPANRAKVDFSERYLGTPARFVARTGLSLPGATPADVGARRVAVAAGTSHEAYLKAFFPEAKIQPYPDVASARAALLAGEADLLFGDGIGLSLWLNGTQANGCCRFVGGPFTESRYFGDGLSVAVKSGNDQLRRAIDYALQRVWEKGVYTDLYLRWFPIGFY
ncbi:amino acid ABC transporter substrate-binding protein (PAAT family) [Azorhizobium sp. AG788]|nr:amino acid ABC transporter substrate-binding protein (PAAT family) [Azorhizobium sp. AG788]